MEVRFSARCETIRVDSRLVCPSLDGEWQAISDPNETFLDYFDDFVEMSGTPDENRQPALRFELVYEPSASGNDDITDSDVDDGNSIGVERPDYTASIDGTPIRASPAGRACSR